MCVQDNVGADAPLRLTRAQSRAVDRYAIDVLGLPGLVLMENAGINAAGAVFDVLRGEFVVDGDSARVAVLCGGGNNGGDGYVIARQLLSWGVPTRVYSVKPVEALTGDAAVNAAAWVALGQRVMLIDDPVGLGEAVGEWRETHVIVDALLGTGLSAERGPIRAEVAAAIEAVAGLVAGGSVSGDDAVRGLPGFRGRVVAVDVPSGLDVDSGQAVGSAVRADLTVTFVAEKAGFAMDTAAEYLGRVVSADIGLPPSAIEAALEWGTKHVR
ncbi:MAG: NAD(P)H-hydrate epimerase [Planctomycetota bacterium]